MVAAPAAGGAPWRPWTIAILGGAFAVALYGGLAMRGLYYDGVFFLLHILRHEDFAWWGAARRTVHALQQAPVLFAIRLDLVNLESAIVLYSTTMTVLPLALTALSYFCFPAGKRHLFVFPLLHYLAGTLAAAVYPLTEASAAAAYFWVLLPLILFRARRPAGAVALLLLALPFYGAHEAMLLLSPILAGAAAWRARRAPSAALGIVFALIALWFLFCFAAQLNWVLNPESAENREGFVSALLGLHWLDNYGELNVPAALGLAALLALLVIRGLELAGGGTWGERATHLIAAAFALGAAYLVYRVAVEPQRLAAVAQMHARNHPALVSLPLAAALLWSLAQPRADLGVLSVRGIGVIGVLAAAALAWHVIAIRHWSDFVRDYRTILAHNRGLVAWKAAVAAAPDGGWRLAKFAPGWRAPGMSLVLAPRGKVAALIAMPPDGGWQPFDPAKPEQLPRSRFYDLTPYLDALKRESRRD